KRLACRTYPSGQCFPFRQECDTCPSDRGRRLPVSRIRARAALTLCAVTGVVACASAAAAPPGEVWVSTVIAGSGMQHYGGDGGPATAAGLTVAGVAVDTQGNIYLADTSDGAGTRIRKIGADGKINTVGGGGTNSRSKEETVGATTA